MKKILYFFLGMLLFSCQSELIHDFAPRVTHARKGYHVTEEEAAAVSLGFVDELKQKTRSSGTTEILSVIPWLLDDMFPQTKGSSGYDLLPDTMLYIVNFKNNEGYVLVPADRRIKGILAYVEEGNLSPTDQIDNEGFKFFLNRLPDYYMNELRGPNFGFDTIPPTPGLLDSWVVDSLVGPLLTTAWHQESPFNDSCPTYSGGHCYAGCLAIATAQVLAHFRQPTSLYGHTYDWDEIMTGPEPQSNAGKASVAQFVYDIGRFIGTNYNSDGQGGSGASFISLKKYLDSLDYNHIPSQAIMQYNYNVSMQSFNDGCLVFISGIDMNTNKGHVWVLDGGAIRRYVKVIYDPNATTIYQYLIHCNWGWGNICGFNGYYESGVFDLQNKIADTLTRSSLSSRTLPSYSNYSLYILHHIQPKQN